MNNESYFKSAEKRLVYKVIAGSKAYDLDLPTSDTDIRGIYIQENEYRLGLGYKEQVSDVKSDIVYYELNRFITLLAQNNPNVLENLFVPDHCILKIDDRFLPLYNNRYSFLTKKIQKTFGGYAISQIKKARGLNKKIVNPVPKKRKIPLDFCYIFNKEDGYMMKARQWLRKHNFNQSEVGLAEMPNGVQLYKLYLTNTSIVQNFRGIVKSDSDEIRHSEIPKGYPLSAYLYYNKDGYSSYCKDYKEYWEWVEKRNPVRYSDNVSHSQNYDGKNMMHCLRMLDMAIEVANGQGMNLIRPNREWLLSVRTGAVTYDEIITLIEEKRIAMDLAFDKSELPDSVDYDFIHNLILEIRN